MVAPFVPDGETGALQKRTPFQQLATALGVDPDADLDDQIAEAVEIAADARQLRRAFNERDEALQKVRELDDLAARLRAAQPEAAPVTLFCCPGCGFIVGAANDATFCAPCGAVAAREAA